MIQWSPAFFLLILALLQPAIGSAQQAPPPATRDVYRVRAGDRLRIRVWPDSTLSGEFPVEQTGLVNLPVLGEVQADGVSLDQLRSQLRAGYAGAMRNPVVTVVPIFKVSVLGAVVRPGLYEITPTQGFWDVIGLAGGFRDDAKQENLRLMRDEETVEINAETGIGDSGPLFDLSMQSGDRIVVPRGVSMDMRDVLWGVQTLAVLIALFR